MHSFKTIYSSLNSAQREAVDTINGPLMVLAGPGTGKTQLLSARVANILDKSDVEPRNILCLTFTDNAARNMRERLETIIGQQAYHVTIHTFHSFGADIISQYSDYFTDRQLLQQIDELGRYELMREIFEHLPHSNPLSAKAGEDYVMLADTLRVIGWFKQNALGPNELHALIAHNQKAVEALEAMISQTFAATPSPKLLASYRQLLDTANKLSSDSLLFGFPEYLVMLTSELSDAINETPADGRYAKPITAWRTRWCEKNAEGKHILKDGGRNMRKMHAVAEVYAKLNEAMQQQGLYDFDDMIIETVHAIERHDDLRYSLQEKFQYILVDEFQDTNKAQLRILQALGNNPVHEGKPNIMVVGDDDQAIYAFQGAEASNMVSFIKLYDAKLVTLTENYRSDEVILDASQTISTQIDDRLATVLDVNKQLTAHAAKSKTPTTHTSFSSELSQYQWIADDIAKRLKAGTAPHDIAVIAPRHKYLERLMPYIGSKQIPVAYERRENILEAPLVIQLTTMTRLIVAIAQNNIETADALLAQVLSYDMWSISNQDMVRTSVEVYKAHKSWLAYCMEHDNQQIGAITSWLVSLARKTTTEPLEYILDELLGPTESDADTSNFVSPMRRTLFSDESLDTNTDDYLTLLGQLASLRNSLRQWKPAKLLLAKDLVEFADLHERSGIKIVDNNPHTQTTDAVQIMTVYKAKGLEFKFVYVINLQDEVWGPTARSQSLKITLPKNLPLAPASDGVNDKLRLLFVALTRAKQQVVLTSYSHTLDNKPSPPLSFLIGSGNDVAHPAFEPISNIKPTTTQSIEILSTDWAYRYRQIIADKPTIFAPILEEYKLSVTHFNNFLDVTKGGPHYFLTRNLLRFPEAPTAPAAYGDAVHRTIQWAHNQLRTNGHLPGVAQLQECFVDLLTRKHLRTADFKRYKTRGEQAIKHYFTERAGDFIPTDLIERGFNNEGVIIGTARLSGKIDKLRIDGKQATVYDFKTGKPAQKWDGRDMYEKMKLHHYRQQLLFYKLLVEGSASYQGKVSVNSGQILFIEPNEQGNLPEALTTSFTDSEVAAFTELVKAVWDRIMKLDFPDVSSYSSDLKGILSFEDDIRSGSI